MVLALHRQHILTGYTPIFPCGSLDDCVVPAQYIVSERLYFEGESLKKLSQPHERVTKDIDSGTDSVNRDLVGQNSIDKKETIYDLHKEKDSSNSCKSPNQSVKSLIDKWNNKSVKDLE